MADGRGKNFDAQFHLLQNKLSETYFSVEEEPFIDLVDFFKKHVANFSGMFPGQDVSSNLIGRNNLSSSTPLLLLASPDNLPPYSAIRSSSQAFSETLVKIFNLLFSQPYPGKFQKRAPYQSTPLQEAAHQSSMRRSG